MFFVVYPRACGAGSSRTDSTGCSLQKLDDSFISAWLLDSFFPRRGQWHSSGIDSIRFTAYDREGYFAYQETLEVPGGSQPVVRDVDFDAGGNAAVGVSARSGASGMISGICFSIAVDDKPAISIWDVTCPPSSRRVGKEI